jgi:hypothetical protein
MSMIGLNDVQTESYLAILTRQSKLMQNNGKYVVTTKGQGYISSSERIRKIKALYWFRTSKSPTIVGNSIFEGKPLLAPRLV